MSKIPEGATHTYAESIGTTYRKNVGGDWFGYADGDWVYVVNPALNRYEPIQAEPEWSGEGLPPVGNTVRVLDIGRPVMDECKIFIGADCTLCAVFMTGTVLMVAVEHQKDLICACFRADMIKTPEQIAAEERDKARTFALNAMTEDGKTVSEPEALWQFRMKVVGEMLDLGFRVDKQVEK